MKPIVQVRDNAVLTAEGYGGLSALTNGIRLVHCDINGGELLDLTAGLTIKSVADWGRYCYDVTPSDWGVGDNFAEVRWTFAKSGQPLRIDGTEGEYLELVAQDSFSGLVGHTAMIQGYLT